MIQIVIIRENWGRLGRGCHFEELSAWSFEDYWARSSALGRPNRARRPMIRGSTSPPALYVAQNDKFVRVSIGPP